MYPRTHEHETIKKTMHSDVLAEVLVHAGPLRLLLSQRREPDVVRDVAARRVQRRWRHVRLVPGRRVLWKFRTARRWEAGCVAVRNGVLCIQRTHPWCSYVFLPHARVAWRVRRD